MRFLMMFIGLIQMGIAMSFILKIFFDGVGQLNPHVLFISGAIWLAVGIYSYLNKYALTPAIAKPFGFTLGINILVIMLPAFMDDVGAKTNHVAFNPEMGAQFSNLFGSILGALPPMLTLLTPIIFFITLASEVMDEKDTTRHQY